MKLQERRKKQSGITLVALVVTIIVLIILATIGIRMIVGEGGLIWQANNAKLEYRAATVDEEVTLWKAEKEIGEYYESIKPQTRNELIDDQLTRGLLTPEEAEDAKEDGRVQIGSRLIDYGIPEGGAGGDSEAGPITFTNFSWPNEGETAEVQINKVSEDGYRIAYRIYENIEAKTPIKGEWTEIASGEKVQNLRNGNVVKAALTDGTRYGKEASFTVYDNVKPKITIENTTSTADSITVTITAEDKQSGIAENTVYTYSIGTEKGNYTVQTKEIASKTCEITGLTTNTEYYIKVEGKDIVGNKGETETEEAIRTGEGNYSISTSGTKRYYTTFAEAYEEAVDNGGDDGGGTIIVERDVTDNFTDPYEINKTIAIDTNGRTMTIGITHDVIADGGILNVTNGTLTIKGNGTISYNEDDWFICGRGGNIEVNDNPTILGVNHPIVMVNGFNGTLDINGGTVKSTMRGALRLEGDGATTIDHAQILAPTASKNAIVCDRAHGKATGTLTIGGQSLISNVSDSGTTNAVSWGSTGKVTINDSRVEGMGGVCLYNDNDGNSAELETNNATLIGKGEANFIKIYGNGPVTIDGGSLTSELSTGIYADPIVTKGMLTLNNTKITTVKKGTVIHYGGNGNIIIHDSILFAMDSAAAVITGMTETNSSLTIDGESIIANGTKKTSETNWYPICWGSSGDLTIKGSTIVTGGIYGWGIYARNAKIKLEDNTSVFCGAETNHEGFLINYESGVGDFIINTNGGVYAPDTNKSGYAIRYYNGAPINVEIIKGSFGANTQEPLKGIKSYMSSYPPLATNTETINFPYLNENGELAYNPVNIYVVDVGR